MTAAEGWDAGGICGNYAYAVGGVGLEFKEELRVVVPK